MRLKRRWIAIIVVSALCAAVILWTLWPKSNPRVTILLADETTLTLTDTDAGKNLLWGGGRWQRMLCKIIGRRLPEFIHNQPSISPAAYTNGIGLSLRRQAKDTNALSTGWNGTGRIYLLDSTGAEIDCALRGVNFITEMRGTNYIVVSEDMNWETSMRSEAELRLRIRETNSQTKVVSTQDFHVKNPAF